MKTSKEINRKFGTVIVLYWENQPLYLTDNTSFLWSYNKEDANVFDCVLTANRKIQDLEKIHTEWNLVMKVEPVDTISSSIQSSAKFLKTINTNGSILSEIS